MQELNKCEKGVGTNRHLRKMLQHDHFLFGQMAVEAAREVFFGEAGQVYPVQAHYLYAVAQVFEDATDDPVAANMDFDTYFILFSSLVVINPIYGREAVFEGKASVCEFFRDLRR